MRKMFLLCLLAMLLTLALPTGKVNAESPWCCGVLGARCASEKEIRDWGRIYGNEGPRQWRGHNCGTPNQVYVAPTPQPSNVTFNLDLSNRDTLQKLSNGVTKVTQSSAAQSYADTSQKVIRQVNKVYQSTRSTCHCSTLDKIMSVKRVGCAKCSF